MRRFYETVDIAPEDGGYRITLDGKAVKTPGQHRLIAPKRAVAERARAEWADQGDEIDPATMPVTRFLNSVIDGIAHRSGDVAETLAAYAASDLLCYRAEGPAELKAEQARLWDPPLDWIARTHDVRLVTTEGIRPADQDAAALERVRGLVNARDIWRLAGLHTATTVTASIVLGLALAEGAFDLETVWAAAMVEEFHQIANWGDDAEARKRRRARRQELEEAADWLALLEG